MLIAKLFLPMAAPGLGAIGIGALAVVTGPIQLIEIVAIVIGLATVVVAGVFTIRTNVAKIWRENYEGEKARADDLTESQAQLILLHAEEKAAWTKHDATTVSHLEKLQAELEVALAKTDQTPVVAKLDMLLAAASASHAIEITGPEGAPVQIERKEG